MSNIRYQYLRTIIRKLELETQTADSLTARFLKNGDASALTTRDIENLGLAVQNSAELAREAAIQLPMVAEVSYD